MRYAFPRGTFCARIVAGSAATLNSSLHSAIRESPLAFSEHADWLGDFSREIDAWQAVEKSFKFIASGR